MTDQDLTVWVVLCEKDDDDRWVEAIFTTEADAEACAAWNAANPPLDGQFDRVHPRRYAYEVEAQDLRTSFDPERPYG